MMADIRILQEQSQQLQNLIAALTETIKAVNGRIDEQTAANRKAFADQKLVVDTLANDIRVVREKARPVLTAASSPDSMWPDASTTYRAASAAWKPSTISATKSG